MLIKNALKTGNPYYLGSLDYNSNVTFNWIQEGTPDPANKKRAIELEYQLRPRIMRFLMDRLGPEYPGDFTDFHFDVDIERREIRLSDKTPEDYFTRLSCDFMQEIGLNCC